MMDAEQLLESYVNGNISYVKKELASSEYCFSDLYMEYIELYKPSIDDIELFNYRLGNQ